MPDHEVPSVYIPISEMDELVGKPQAEDLLVIVDIDDFSETPTGKTKKVKYGNIFPSTSEGEGTVVEDTVVVLDDPLFYDIQPGTFLKEVIVKPSSDTDFSIGNTQGGDEIFQSQPITAVEGWVFLVNRVAWELAVRVYFTGLPSSSQIYVIIKRLI